ncbi:MAG: hypothetical protein IJ309_02870 [Clostridia bacterium]|nr:hypothetical protein [Clostridia bacterium]
MEKTNEQIKNEMAELNAQFNEFLHTKGIGAKFKLAFNNMAESARIQHQADVQKFNEEKAKSAEANKDFVEFLHTKGFKAKLMLVIENMKKGAKEASKKTAEQIARAKAQAKGGACTYTTEELALEFNKFLKEKGLDSQYTVVVTECNN